MRPSLDQTYLKMLDVFAQRSTCRRRQVAAIITDSRGRVLSIGYNGVPSRFEHCTDVPCLGAQDPPGDTTRCLAVHAEQNALLQCQDLNQAHVIYCSCLPCFTCAKLICNTPIKGVVCAAPYADEAGFNLFVQKQLMIICEDRYYNYATGEFVSRAS